ncbi:hypothetical protein [Paenibacillus sp. NAIST15-1]|uniref:restriction endonuclease n=1 Tax=Paenibacillus sp. NAIST15-1 TaxID=1605994 RepID=UPI0009FA24AA
MVQELLLTSVLRFDLVAQNRETGELIAIQCKYYSNNMTANKLIEIFYLRKKLKSRNENK